jgi:hypothetical protein
MNRTVGQWIPGAAGAMAALQDQGSRLRVRERACSMSRDILMKVSVCITLTSPFRPSTSMGNFVAPYSALERHQHCALRSAAVKAQFRTTGFQNTAQSFDEAE